jgi:hypothetical protein
MCCLKTAWDISQAYVPYSPSNAELTSKEQANENNISSAYGGIVGKNVAQENNFTATLWKTVYCNPITGAIHISAASVSSTDTDSTICRVILYYTDGTDSSMDYSFSRGSNISLDINIGTKTIERIVIYASDNYSHSTGDTVTVSDLMICTQADYAASPNYQPCVLSNAELTGEINPTQLTIPAIPTGAHATLESGGYTVTGNIVIVNMRLRFSQAMTTSFTICENLPIPLADSSLAANSSIAPVNNNKGLPLVLNKAGEIIMPTGATMPAEMVLISCIYVKA